MNKKCLVLVAILMATFTGFAQMSDSDDEFKVKGHGFGAIYSSSNGKGLVYRYLPKKNGFHTAFIPISTTDKKYSSLNFTGYHEVFRRNDVRLFVQAGIEWVNTTQKETLIGKYSSGLSYSETVTSTDNSFNPAGGLALEVGSDVLKLTAFLGYGAYIKTTNIDDKLPLIAPRKDETLLNLSGGIAVFVVI